MSPFQALYGREPPNLFDTYAKPLHNAEVADMLVERENTLRSLKCQIAKAQRAMVEFANRKRRDVEFNVGDSVFLKLQPYRQLSVEKPLSYKLARRYYGPFVILERIGKVAYRLQLPADSRIHNVFHVSLLKPFVPSFKAVSALPDDFKRSQPNDTPMHALASRTVLVDQIPQEQWLVQWSSDALADANWEDAVLLKEHFPDLRLEDKAFPKEGGVDTTTELDEHATPDNELHEPMQPDRTSPAADQEEAGGRGRSQNRPEKRERPKRVRSRPMKYKDYVDY